MLLCGPTSSQIRLLLSCGNGAGTSPRRVLEHASGRTQKILPRLHALLQENEGENTMIFHFGSVIQSLQLIPL